MFSIRNAGSAALLGLVVTGCTKMGPPYHPASLNRTPMVADGAMQVRDWEQQTARYNNGTAVSAADWFIAVVRVNPSVPWLCCVYCHGA